MGIQEPTFASWVPCVLAAHSGDVVYGEETIRNSGHNTYDLRFDLPIPGFNEAGKALVVLAVKVVVDDADADNSITNILLQSLSSASFPVDAAMFWPMSGTLPITSAGTHKFCMGDTANFGNTKTFAIHLSCDTEDAQALKIVSVLALVAYTDFSYPL